MTNKIHFPFYLFLLGITWSIFLCIELNAHHLIYLTLLVADNQLPAEVLKVFYFNSQTCQNFFRLTRAISGTFSVSVNFTVQQYLDQKEKISMLNSIKTETSSSFTKTIFEFPNHHKKRWNHEQSTILPEKINKHQIKEHVDPALMAMLLTYQEIQLIVVWRLRKDFVIPSILIWKIHISW